MRRRVVLGLAAAGAGGVVAAAAGTSSAGTPSAGTLRAGDMSSGSAEVPAAVVPGAAGQRVYLGSYTNSGGGGIGLASADPATGALTVDSWSRAVADPSWVELSGDRRFLYAVTESTPTGRISAFALDGQGRPTLLGGQPTGAGPCHIRVHPGGRYLFVSNYDAGTVQVYPIRADGSPGPATDTRQHKPASGKASAHAHQTVVDPTGGYVLAVDLGLDTVFGYTLDAAAGRLQDRFRVPLKAKSGPRHLAFHPSGDYAYVVGELDSTVTVCTWRSGVLTPGAVLSTRPKPGTGSTGAGVAPTNNPAEIAVSADGRFVYVSNRGDDTVAVFTVTGGGSTLRLVGAPACGGKGPRDLVIDPTGARLYCANEGSGDITWLTLDPATGVPTGKPGKAAAKAATRVLFA